MVAMYFFHVERWRFAGIEKFSALTIFLTIVYMFFSCFACFAFILQLSLRTVPDLIYSSFFHYSEA